jgi:hypothetical protein
MKAKTAAKLLSFAFEEGDEDAVRIACQEKPWDLIDHSNDRSFSFHPIYTTFGLIARGIKNRDGSLDKIRKSTASCLQMMVAHGYRPKIDQLGKLAEKDAYVFTKLLRSLVKLENPIHPHLFHYLMADISPASAISKACLKVGFDPNEKDDAGNTPLHAMWEKTVLSNSMRTQYSEADLWWDHTTRLVEAGAQIHTPNPRGATVGEMIERAITLGAPGGAEKMAWVAQARAQQLNALTSHSSLPSQSRRLLTTPLTGRFIQRIGPPCLGLRWPGFCLSSRKAAKVLPMGLMLGLIVESIAASTLPLAERIM